MEMQLQELIEKIKQDGVKTAEAEAEAILKSANEKAEKIIADAKVEAEKLVLNAKQQNERTVKSGEDAIRQAGRNLLISFRESVTKELEAILNNGVLEAYSPKNLTDLIIKVVEAWSKNTEASDISIILNSNDLKEVEGTLLSALKEKMLQGVTLKANDNFDGGFRIAVNQGQAYYDFSAEAVVEMLSAYLSPKVSALLKEAETV